MSVTPEELAQAIRGFAQALESDLEYAQSRQAHLLLAQRVQEANRLADQALCVQPVQSLQPN